MKSLYIDGQAGAAGDMLLGALIDLGVDPNRIIGTLRPIVSDHFDIHVETVSRCGINARRVHVEVSGNTEHRHLSQVVAGLDKGSLSANVRQRAENVYRRLAEAEAHVHNSTPENVHFHEVGADDAVIDIVGVLCGIEWLGVNSVYCEPLVLGSGVGRSAHGPIHYPAPATLQLLKDKPTRMVSGLGETTTPTGAAILAEIAEFTDSVLIVPERIGYGAGTRELPDRPNLLRATLGAVPAWTQSDTLWLCASDIDNTRPEVFEWVEQKMRDAGAVDVTLVDVGMKKGRHGVRVEALCDSSTRAAITDILLSETGTLGVRWHSVVRSKLPRTVETVGTPWGPIRVKVAHTTLGPRGIPEYDDCRLAAAASGVPLIAIMEEVSRRFAESRAAANHHAEG